MFPLTIRKDSEWFNYHIGDGLEEYTLCRYIPVEIDNERDKHIFLNQQTQKHHILWSEKLRDEFARNPLDAAIMYKEQTDNVIEEHLNEISKLKKSQYKALEEARLLVSVSKDPESSN